MYNIKWELSYGFYLVVIYCMGLLVVIGILYIDILCNGSYGGSRGGWISNIWEFCIFSLIFYKFKLYV